LNQKIEHICIEIGGMYMNKILLFSLLCLLISTTSLASDVAIDSAGNVETGITNPAGSGNLDVTGASGEHAIRGVTSGTGAAGVYGESAEKSGYGGYFQGNVHVTDDLTVEGTLTAPALGDISVVPSGNVGIGTNNPGAKLEVVTTPVDFYGNWLPYDAYYNPCEHCADTCNGNHSAEYTCPGGQSISCEDIRNDNGEEWEYRIVECQQTQQAGQFGGNVTVSGAVSATSFTGDGGGLTNVTASDISIDCPYNYILRRKVSDWVCEPFCQDGDIINCYTGPAGTLNVGSCAAGTRTCSSSTYSACNGQIWPSAEVCNNLIDDDCNGIVDDAAQYNAPGCSFFYIDTDNDNYGDENAPGICACNNPDPSSYADNNLDCYDALYWVNPNGSYNTTTYGNPPSWDYNCNGQIEKKDTTVFSGCTGNQWGNCAGDGWTIALIPNCGETASWKYCEGPWPACTTITTTNTQECK
jgi:hypothetical protein